MVDYSNLVYVHDREGNEYACPVDVLKGHLGKTEELTDAQKKNCIDMSTAIDQFWG